MDDCGNPISLARWVRPSTLLLSPSFLPEADFESLTTVNKQECEPGKSQSGRKAGFLFSKRVHKQNNETRCTSGCLEFRVHLAIALDFSERLSLETDFFVTALSPLVRFDIWEKGNISLLQLSERLRSALRHALCDALMEFHVLPNPLCVETSTELEDPDNIGKILQFLCC